MKKLIAGCGVLAALAISLLFCLPGKGAAPPESRLTVHEWGTFTALQDDDGTAIGGINIDDEPLPRFVHHVRRDLVAGQFAASLFSKSVSVRHPDVNLRLETPVLYFYPAAGEELPLELDVHVDFRGGWLTEFYPNADAQNPGLPRHRRDMGQLSGQTTGSLDWRRLAVGTNTAGPDTEQNVWLAPRQVQAASVTTELDESERYLFYRGVGHLEAPLTVLSNPREETIELRANLAAVPADALPPAIGPLWLIHVRDDGQLAFRELAPLPLDGHADRVLATAPRGFSESDFSATAIDAMSDSMHRALVRAGLYDDEATAMLQTWRQSYFASPGLRLFSIVPRAWTDAVLPLRLSQPAAIERVMMARIELISPEQRKLLAQLRRGPTAVDQPSLDLEMPSSYELYSKLGRFRSPLVATEAARRPSENLQKFTALYHDLIPKR